MLFALAALAAAHPPATAAHDPIPDRPLIAWLADSDYPAGAIQREVSGHVRFRLDVGSDGTPTRCTITQSVDPELDRTTCDIFMARAHFQPARDRRGRAVAGSFAGGVNWVLPPENESPSPLEALRVANAIRLDAHGDIICSWSRNGSRPVDRSHQECGFLSGSGAGQAVRTQAIPGDLILVYTIVPHGAATPAGNDEAGAELAYEETAHLVIAPDGTLVECRPGPAHAFPNPLPIRLPSSCWQLGGPPMVAPSTSQDMRQAETAIRVYVRRRPAP